ncbi:alpha-methylacyl-CoA racemase [Advenella incenata]|uniref:Alpha-methylacyl-CoA racemase n=1 Tax=Advenella incenata TaxID=267800 RepID=A0A4Q7V6N6_9BURK|nr:CaiB/BaiF CoA-transferase family protein [Advenella incenata]RZT92271.1 alpha-methylacyl-CoA racemase [Advenella incenata]
MTKKSVLAGVRIVEFSAIGPVPWAAMVLADMGADVVRIVKEGTKHDTAMLRGRRVLQVDLKTECGVNDAKQVIQRADILLEGMRPKVMERLGLGPSVCFQLNPKLVYGRMTGWGQSGPLAQTAGHDINYIALTGALHAIGREKPVPPLNLIGDYGGGATFLLIGVLAAFAKVRAGGEGQVVDAAMVDGAALLMALQYERLASGEWRDQRESNVLDGGAPWYDVYETLDGKYIALGAIEPQFYQELLNGLGLSASELPDRKCRENWPVLRRIFADRIMSRTRQDWESCFAGTDACVSPVLSMKEAPEHPHNAARSIFEQCKGAYVPMVAPRFSSMENQMAEHTENITLGRILEQWAQ